MAADHDADKAAFVTGFKDRFVAFVSGQAGLDDDFLDLVGREIFEQAYLFQKEALQIDFTHAVSPPCEAICYS
jgi:hypothetical protein